MKDKIKNALFSVSPAIFGGLFAIRSRRVGQETEQRENLDDLSQEMVVKYGSVVRAGPFEGMVLPEAMHNRHIGPFLFGSYESTLHSSIQRLATGAYDVIVDVGSSFGYYATGLARIFPATPVFAFDTDPWARKRVREMALLNECDNIQVGVACTPKILLEKCRGRRCLVLSDCEGYEYKLFNASVVQALRHSDVIIEIHPAGDQRALNALRSRFEVTHAVHVVGIDPIEKKESFLPSEAPVQAAQEWRSSGQKWLICKSTAA